MNQKKKRVLQSLAGVIGFLAIVFFVTQRFQLAIVSGESMVPAVADRSVVLIHKQSEPKRYDMVAFAEKDKSLIKRVVGVPGDTYVRSGNRLLIGAAETAEDFSFLITLTEETAAEFPTSGTLQAGEYFVMGDAVASSRDSRAFGLVSEKQLLGSVTPIF